MTGHIPKKNNPCPDCGEYPVNHASEWFSALFETAMTPVALGIERAVRGVKPSIMRHAPDRAALPLLRVLAALRLGTIKTDVDEYDSGRNRWLWDSAHRRGITMYQFRSLGRPDGTDFFVAQFRGKTVAFEGLPRPDRGISKSLDWMDNKAILKKRLTAAGIPMARGRACRTFAQALATMREVGGMADPVITKPHIGSRSRHSTIGIRTPEELRIGFDKAKRLSPWVIVEQELQGYLFRVLLIRGTIAGIIRREQAYVTGDGVSTIRELIARENKNPRRAGPTFHQLPTDDSVEAELNQQNLTRDSIPASGKIVRLNPHISRYYGGSTSDFTSRVHPDNAALFHHIAAVLGDSLVGVDFIIGDMEKSWREQKLCGVIECNSLPNIDLHHDVLYGESRDIGGMLLDIAFEK
jgi:D-alanine-D-alanine ligase-like ATP-grasp enzyme